MHLHIMKVYNLYIYHIVKVLYSFDEIKTYLIMENFIKSTVFICFVNLFFGFSIFGQTAPPTPNPKFLYYCLNDNASPLSATTSGGGTLRWYTTATGGSFSTNAPTPITTVTASPTPLTYYVTQVIGGIESAPRTEIFVYVNQKLDLYCQTITPNSIKFDFANTGQSSFTYSYTVDGGAPITGTHTAPSNFTVSGLNEKQSVMFTLTAVGAKACVTPQTVTCTTTCSPANIKTPDFPAIVPFCTGTPAPLLSPTSPNGITGTWSPSTISNTTSGNYVFVPNDSKCINSQTLAVTVRPLVQPNFANVSICSGGVVPILNTTSPNGIKGTWLPATINNMVSGAYVFSPSSNECATSQTINVTVIPSNTLLDVNWTVSEAFVKNQIVTVIATGTGDFLYQLDDGLFQESAVFENVSFGSHSVTVKDKNCCSTPITRTNVLVINYPKFFTPNADGYNDTWNVFTLQEQLNSKIQIFDRHGKFLKEIFPNGLGWDGTYIGQPMPSNDYWFSIEYTEKDIPKKFKSHFSLKR